MSHLSIIIPVYNEGANFQKLWNEISRLTKAPFSAYVVYDFDEDDTVPVVKQIIAAGALRAGLSCGGRQPLHEGREADWRAIFQAASLAAGRHISVLPAPPSDS